MIKNRPYLRIQLYTHKEDVHNIINKHINKINFFITFVSEFQHTLPVFFIFQYLMNLVPGRRRVPSGKFSSKNRAVMAGTARGHGRFGRLHPQKKTKRKRIFYINAAIAY